MTHSSKKPRSLINSSLVVGGGTLLSRVLGLARDIVIANMFGTGGATDAFLIAFKIPNFLRRLFAEGAFAQAFVPVLAEYKESGGIEAVRALLAHVSFWLGRWLIIITVLVIVAAPYVAVLFAPGYWWNAEPEKLAQVSESLRIVFPYLFLISFTALSGSVLNIYGRFAVPALTPILLNLSLIFFAVVVSPLFDIPIYALAWGVLAAGCLQLIFQLPFLAREGVLVRPAMSANHEGVKKIAILMLPALFGVSVSQINLLLDTVLASLLVDGSVSWLYYSDRLSELPLGIIGIAIATVVLPSLSKDHAASEGERFGLTLTWAIRVVCLLGVPAAMALFVLAEPLITTIFYRGAMTPEDVLMTSYSLRAYSLGLLAFMLIKILAPGYFARQDIKTPVKIAIKAMVANMMLNLCLVFWLDHVGLALATSISAWLNAGLLYFGLRSSIQLNIDKASWLTLIRIFAAGLGMAVLLFIVSNDGGLWLQMSEWQRVGTMAWLVPLGLASFLSLLVIFGARPSHFKH